MYPNWLTYCLISSIRDSELFAFLSIKLDSSRGQLGYLISNNMGTTNLALSDKFGYSGVVYIFSGTRAINYRGIYHTYKQPEPNPNPTEPHSERHPSASSLSGTGYIENQ